MSNDSDGPRSSPAIVRPSRRRRALATAFLYAPLWPALRAIGQSLAADDWTPADEAPVSDELLGPYFPYSYLSSLPATVLRFGEGTLRVMTASRPRILTRPQLLNWLDTRVRAIADYFSTVPGSPVDLLLVFVEGTGVKGGTSWGHRGAASRILIGRSSTIDHLSNDWILVHELVHHALPSVASQHHWMEEGLATYVEPIVRTRAGLMTEQTYWLELMAGLPKGLPAAGDAGLDKTPTWGRTYWGGALFYFLADLEARKRTNKSLRDALVALLRAGGNITRAWPPRRIFETFDNALGHPAFMPLYERMRASPYPVALEELWKQLGVSIQMSAVVFDDAAPLAHIRRAMTSGGDSAP